MNVVIPVPIDPFLWDRRLEELLSVPARRGHRIPVRLRDWSRFVSDADEDDGVVVNIGARGVLLETARQLELGTKVGLSFSLPGDPAPVAVVGQVVRLAGRGGGLARVGRRVPRLPRRRARADRGLRGRGAEARAAGGAGARAHGALLRRDARVGGGAARERDPEGADPRLRARLHPDRGPRGAHHRVQRRRAPALRLQPLGGARPRGGRHDRAAGAARRACGGSCASSW